MKKNKIKKVIFDNRGLPALLLLCVISFPVFAVDTDGDGVDDTIDNCPAVMNYDQYDFDGDGIGDVCDDDNDNDSWSDVEENQCYSDPWSNLSVPSDRDGDGICDPIDNCFYVSNVNQLDSDSDGKGDVCDLDDDEDGFANEVDPFPQDPTRPALVLDGVGRFESEDTRRIFGYSLDGIGDVNQDGYSDFIVGNPLNQYLVEWLGLIGEAYVFSGFDGSVIYQYESDFPGDEFGANVAGLGDLNLDGYPDFLVSASFHNKYAGKVIIYSGLDGSVMDTLYPPHYKENGTGFGRQVAVLNDVNGDSYPDIAVSLNDDTNGNDSGSVRVYSGSDRQELYAVHGESGDRLVKVEAAGDINADGYEDFLVGVSQSVFFYTNPTYVRLISGVDGSDLFRIDAQNMEDYVGWTMSKAGDVNVDGYGDFIIGTWNNSSYDQYLNLYSGSDFSILFEFESGPYDSVYMRAAGDINQDGYDDLVHTVDGGVVFYSGMTYEVLYSFIDVAPGLGQRLAMIGDMDGDGLGDMLSGTFWGSPSPGSEPQGIVASLFMLLDSDADGMADWFENRYGFDPLVDDAALNSDADPLTNLQEFQNKTNPLLADTDSDGVNDDLDLFPIDDTEWFDADNDGVGDNFDHDDDNDGYADVVDPFPMDNTKPVLLSSGPGFFLSKKTRNEYGPFIDGLGDLNKDGYDDVIIGAREYTNTDKGFVEILSGKDGSVLREIESPNVGNGFGGSVAGLGDINKDTYPDYAISAPYTADQTGAGLVWVYSGYDNSVIRVLGGAQPEDWFGDLLTNMGDVNSDGYEDLLVGVTRSDVNGVDSGSAEVYSGLDGSQLFAWYGESAGDRFGFARNAGDVNNDGYPDVIVGRGWNTQPYEDAGYIKIFSGQDGVTLHHIVAPNADTSFGRFVDGAGDVNADGYDDFIVGAMGDYGWFDRELAGTALVYSGQDGSVMYSTHGDVRNNGSDPENDGFGRVRGVGDINQDGYDDFAVGIPYSFSTHSGTGGKIKIYSGKTGEYLYHIGEGAGFGSYLALAGDVDADGKHDVLVGLYDINAFLAGIETRKPVATIFMLIDSDGDGMADGYETVNGLNPLVDDAAGDVDADGLSNVVEYQLRTWPTASDSDGDGIPDGLEDSDGDGLLNVIEVGMGTDPADFFNPSSLPLDNGYKGTHFKVYQSR